MNRKSRRHKTLLKATGLLPASLLLFVLLAWLPATVQAAHTATKTAFYEAPHSTLLSTPAVDPTVTALTKQKLENDTNWFWNYGAILITSLVTTLSLLGGGLFALMRWSGERQAERERRKEEHDQRLAGQQVERERRDEEQQRWLRDRQNERERRDEEQQRWLADRQAERKHQDEERFQAVVEGLGSTNKATQVGAAITLRTFLRPGFEQFYGQAFDLAVAHLRLRKATPDSIESLDSLSLALVTIFKESFPLIRKQQSQNMQQLDASHIQLDNTYLVEADLSQGWMPQTYLRQANLLEANLKEANLNEADLSGADLSFANLSKARLYRTNFSRANLSFADLSGAGLTGANLSGAGLIGADLSGADLSFSDLSGADLSEAHLESVLLFEQTKLLNVKGLTQKELEMYKTKGAII